MEKQYKQIDDAITGEVIKIELTAEEYAELAERQAEAARAENIEIEAEAAKEAAQAKLAALGLTTDDLKALGLGTN